MLGKISKAAFAATLILSVSFIGCTQEDAPKEDMAEMSAPEEMAAEVMPAMRTAVAHMSPTEGNEASGTVTFTEVEGGIRVVAHFENVPEGEHGFHIHEFGDCSAPDGTSAGGHFNPGGMKHSSPDSSMRHVGDLGNIAANADGIAEKEMVDSMLTFDGDHSILGKGVILHADADDLMTQPTGAAGARIACGVVEIEDMMSNK
jgi:Cu-Zn family superoxide dismutase